MARQPSRPTRTWSKRESRRSRRDHLATLIYTSGTTGRPKGVELLHARLVLGGRGAVRERLIRGDDLQYLWLPLSHSFGKTLAVALVHAGLPTYVDGRVDKIVANLGGGPADADVRGAPRLREGLQRGGRHGDRGGRRQGEDLHLGGTRRPSAPTPWNSPASRCPPVLRSQRAIADKLVFSKLRDRLGGRIRVLVSGSAPLSTDISSFFAAAGLPIYEGYGLTENVAPATSSTRPAACASAPSASRSATSSARSTWTARSCSAACR